MQWWVVLVVLSQRQICYTNPLDVFFVKKSRTRDILYVYINIHMDIF